jgi:hypothetical protein
MTEPVLTKEMIREAVNKLRESEKINAWGSRPIPVRIYPSGIIWTDPSGKDCFISDPPMHQRYLNTLTNKVYVRTIDLGW